MSLIRISSDRASEPPSQPPAGNSEPGAPCGGFPHGDASVSKSGLIVLFDTWANESLLSGALSALTKPKPSARCHSRYLSIALATSIQASCRRKLLPLYFRRAQRTVNSSSKIYVVIFFIYLLISAFLSYFGRVELEAWRVTSAASEGGKRLAPPSGALTGKWH